MNVKSLIARLREWWRGEYLPSPSDMFVSPGEYDQPLLARVVVLVWRFWLVHWKFVLSFVVAVVALL